MENDMGYTASKTSPKLTSYGTTPLTGICLPRTPLECCCLRSYLCHSSWMQAVCLHSARTFYQHQEHQTRHRPQGYGSCKIRYAPIFVFMKDNDDIPNHHKHIEIFLDIIEIYKHVQLFMLYLALCHICALLALAIWQTVECECGKPSSMRHRRGMHAGLHLVVLLWFYYCAVS